MNKKSFYLDDEALTTKGVDFVVEINTALNETMQKYGAKGFNISEMESLGIKNVIEIGRSPRANSKFLNKGKV